MRIWGFEIIGFDSLDILGWPMFHGLDIAAVLVIPGASYFLWRRMKDRAAITGQRFGYDLVPLIALISPTLEPPISRQSVSSMSAKGLPARSMMPA